MPEEGSFKQNVIAGIVSGLIVAGVSVPFTVFATRLIESWIPSSPDPQLQKMIDLLEKQNALLRKSMGLPKSPTNAEKQQCKAADQFIADKQKDLQVVRSVTSQSFKAIYRPIGRSASQVGIIGGVGGKPSAIVDEEVLSRIKADEVDDFAPHSANVATLKLLESTTAMR